MAISKENINRIERIYILSKTEFKQRYFDTKLGVLWAFINPVLRLFIFYFIFTYIFNHHTKNYALYIFIGIIFWIFFSEVTKKGINQFVSKRYLLINIQINKLDIFISSVLSSFIGFLFNCIVFFIVSLFFPVNYSYNILYFLLIIINLYIFTLSINMILSTVFIYFRDLNHLWDIVLLIGFWTLPIIWDQNVILEKAKFICYINPLTGILINVREIALFNQTLSIDLFLYDFIYSIILFFISYWFMKKFSKKAMEKL